MFGVFCNLIIFFWQFNIIPFIKFFKEKRMDNSENSMISLDKFAFKEVLGGDPARKSIFLLLDGADSKKAVMLCNKQAFEEDGEKITPWLASAKLSLTVKNDKYGNYEMFIPPECNPLKTTFIYPANEFDIERYRRQNVHLIYETAADYGSITLPFIEESKYKDNLKWVYNFLEKKSEVERIVFENEDKVNGFLLAPDLKWNGKNMDEMYFLAIANCRNLRSVRDLTPNELPLLENIRNCAEFIKEKYGISRSQLKFYFHYQPTFYHLHVHIVHMNYEAPGLGCTSILLDNVIDNLKLFPDYYAKATLPFIRKENDALYQKYLEAGRV